MTFTFQPPRASVEPGTSLEEDQMEMMTSFTPWNSRDPTASFPIMRDTEANRSLSMSLAGSEALQSIGSSRSGSFMQQFASIRPIRKSWSLEDLQASWGLLILRIYHGLCFIFAIVMIAGVGLNSEVNLFLYFFETATHMGTRWRTHSQERDLLSMESWVNITATITTAVLLMMFFTGILLRGVWLLVDATRVDMFKNYRRTLCCEGSGPGCFQKGSQRKVIITSKTQRREVHKHLSLKCIVLKEFTIANQIVPAGSQLLALNAMQGKEGRDDVLDLDISVPATLVFHVDTRPIDFRGKAKVRGLVDMIFQAVIFITLDTIPIIYALLEVFESGIFSVLWLQTLMTSSVIAAISHALLYYIWSSIMEYVFKFTSFQLLREHLCEITGDQHDDAEAQTPEAQTPEAQTPESNANKLERSASALHMRTDKVARLANYEVMIGRRRNKDDTRKTGFDRHDSKHNICVYIHNVFLHAIEHCPKSYMTFLVSGWLSVAALVWLWHDPIVQYCRIALCFLAIFSVLALARFECLKRLRQRVEEFRRKRAETRDVLIQSQSAEALKARWFQVYCSIDEFSATMKAGLYFLAAFVFLGRGIYKEAKRLIVLGVVFFFACIVLIFFVIKRPSRIWKVVLLSTSFNLVVILVSASMQDGPTGGFTGFYQRLLLCFVTQLGLTRQSDHKRPVFLFGAIFVGVVVVLVGLTSLATLGRDGASFGDKDLGWCSSEDESPKSCRDFVFPENGSEMPYQLCGVSWKMGWENGTCGTVSERCKDPKLSVVDFAFFANLPYFLPNKRRAQQVLDHDFPGWEIKHIQTYNATIEQYTTFAHFSRGSTHVIAVRGTWSAIESLHDLNYWLPAGFVQTTQRLGPAILDSSSIMRRISQLDFLQAKKGQFKDLKDYTNATTIKLPSDHVLYMTGHSLGGGLAQIVGGLLKVPAITFSSPGLKATSLILDPPPKMENLVKSSLNVVPEKDVVPKVDEQVGSEMRIRCRGKSMYCHSLQTTMCELLATCGDGRSGFHARKYSRSCESCKAFHSDTLDKIPSCQSSVAKGA